MMSFINRVLIDKRKVYTINNDLDELNNHVSVQPSIKPDLPSLSYLLNDQSSCLLYNESTDDPIDLFANPTKLPFLIKLNPQKSMDQVALSSSTSLSFFDLRFVSGLYAFCLIQDKNSQQYLLLKRLENHESNHPILGIYLKRGKFGKELANANIICGGEIVFERGVLLSWNLKSGAYSANTNFDEIKSLEFQRHLQTLWLPQSHYLPIATQQENFYQAFFTPRGSIRDTGAVELNESIRFRFGTTACRETFFDSSKSRQTCTTKGITPVCSNDSIATMAT